MSVALDGLLLMLNPAVLRRDMLREMVWRQQEEIAGHLGMSASDLFLPLPPEMPAQVLQEIGRDQSSWLSIMIDRERLLGSPQRGPALAAIDVESLE